MERGHADPEARDAIRRMLEDEDLDITSNRLFYKVSVAIRPDEEKR
jgi:hypothetical protein